MNRVHCTNCGEDGHVRWDCRKPAKESVASKEEGITLRRSAKSTSLTTDNNAVQVKKASTGNADGSKPLTQTEPANKFRDPESDGFPPCSSQTVCPPSLEEGNADRQSKPIQKTNRTADRHKPGYMRSYMVKWRAAKRSQSETEVASTQLRIGVRNTFAGTVCDEDRQYIPAALAQKVEASDLKSVQVSVRPREAAPKKASENG